MGLRVTVKTWTRWFPALVAGVVVAAGAVAVPIAANASATLPDKTAAQVIALMQRENVTAFSGTIEQTSDLGLPSVQGLSEGGQSSVSGSSSGAGSDSGLAAALELATGSHSVRVFVDGPKNLRAQVMDQLAERDVIRHGNSVWIYDSKAGTAEHATIPAKSEAKKGAKAGAKTGARMPGLATAPKTPAQIADLLLAQLRPSSTVRVDQVSVAGRSAYELVLAPRSTDSLLGSVKIAVDGATGLPLRVQLAARGSDTAAVSVGFSAITLAKPAASLFDFTPPKSATVKQLTAPAKKDSAAQPKTHPKSGSAAKPKVSVSGSGWDSVVTVSGATQLGSLQKSPQFAELTTAVAGGRLFHTTLANILFLDDGRIVVGSVSAAKLESAASAK
jgi:outer membrane lipoprotein-sorting protein